MTKKVKLLLFDSPDDVGVHEVVVGKDEEDDDYGQKELTVLSTKKISAKSTKDGLND